MQKRHTIFIAISLPNEIKRALAGYEKKWMELPAKWIPENNLHITLVFLGKLTDIELGEACVIVKEVAERHRSLNICLRAIGYGPDKKIPPKMVWATGDPLKELSLLKKELEDAFLQKIVNFEPEHRGFTPHVTMAKINAFAWRSIEPEERPNVDESVELLFTVESIEVMESQSKKSGPEYVVIESILLGN